MKKYFGILGMACVLLFVTACQSKVRVNDSGFSIYCLDTNATKLGSVPYNLSAGDVENEIEECLDQLQTEPSDLTLVKAIPDTVTLRGYRWNGQGEVVLEFDTSYMEEKGTTEVLRRAAIVKSLCQIEGVDYVQFEVDGQPLTDSNGNMIGLMAGGDFIDNTSGDENSQQTSRLSVYFADTSGEGLVEIPIEITYDTTMSIEKLVIEQMISGPYTIDGVDRESVLPTVPEDTKLLKVSIKDSVCYVDFSEEFFDKSSDITNEVAVYSVVNSLVELPSINKVQFTIEGAQEAFYRDSIVFDQPFERNLDLVGETLH